MCHDAVCGKKHPAGWDFISRGLPGEVKGARGDDGDGGTVKKYREGAGEPSDGRRWRRGFGPERRWRRRQPS